jgi:hypothetical protein
VLILEAQCQVRQVYRGGVIGHLVAGTLWLIAASIATWGTPGAAIATLCVGGVFIFPVTTLVLSRLGGPAALPATNPFRALGTQVAFVLPLSMPVLLTMSRAHADRFFPAMLILVGAHYLPFVTLYGMRSFLALAVVLVTVGVSLLFTGLGGFTAGAWLGAGVLWMFAALAHQEYTRMARG